jgi:hypothetical protein
MKELKMSRNRPENPQKMRKKFPVGLVINMRQQVVFQTDVGKIEELTEYLMTDQGCM